MGLHASADGGLEGTGTKLGAVQEGSQPWGHAWTEDRPGKKARDHRWSLEGKDEMARNKRGGKMPWRVFDFNNIAYSMAVRTPALSHTGGNDCCWVKRGGGNFNRALSSWLGRHDCDWLAILSSLSTHPQSSCILV